MGHINLSLSKASSTPPAARTRRPCRRPIEPGEPARRRDAGVDQVTLMVASGWVEKLLAWLDRLAEDFVVPPTAM